MAAGTYYTGRYLGGVLGASLAGAVLGTTVTAAGVTLGFGLLVLVGLGVVVVSFGLPGRRRPACPGAWPLTADSAPVRVTPRRDRSRQRTRRRVVKAG